MSTIYVTVSLCKQINTVHVRTKWIPEWPEDEWPTAYSICSPSRSIYTILPKYILNIARLKSKPQPIVYILGIMPLSLATKLFGCLLWDSVWIFSKVTSWSTFVLI